MNDLLAREVVVLLGGPLTGTRDVLLIFRAERRGGGRGAAGGGLLERSGAAAHSAIEPWWLRLGTVARNPCRYLGPLTPQRADNHVLGALSWAGGTVMQQQERDLIADLVRPSAAIRKPAARPRGRAPDRELCRRQPASPYLLVQTALVQEEALKQARARIAELESKASGQASGREVSSATRRDPPARGARHRPRHPSRHPHPAVAVGPAPQAAAGGGFLRSALTTAAGVAGGALLFEGIRNMFGHSTQAFASPLSDVQPADSLYPTIVADAAGPALVRRSRARMTARPTTTTSLG